jgi:quinol-cytochrome oxidoreductase complex cytochrome b subunit
MEEKAELDNKSEEEKGIPFFPNHMLKEIVMMCAILAGISILAVFFPAPMEEKADPFTTPLHIKPEWYFLAGYMSLAFAEKLAFLGAWAPKLIGVLAQGVVVLFLFIFPFFDKNPERNPRKRPIAMTLGGLFVLSFAILTLLGHLK